MRPGSDWPEVGLDAFDRPGPVERQWPWLQSRGPALGVRPTAAPTAMFVLIGAALGPHASGILSASVQANLEAVVWVALAVIGVYVGLGLGSAVTDAAPRVLGGALLGPTVTAATVAGGLFALMARWDLPIAAGPFAACAVIGICASVSAAPRTSAGANPHVRRAVQLADLDDVPLIVFGVLTAAILAGGSVVPRMLMTVVAGAGIGLAGTLLIERASAGERGVFVTGAVLLLAGIGAHLGTSPLLGGCVAALVSVRAPGQSDRMTAADLRTLQHPLVALLLIIAGAMVEWSAAVLWLTAALVLLRMMGKLLAAMAVTRLVGVPPAMLATVLLHPGIMGIALALNVREILGPGYTWLVSVVTTATVVSEVLSAFLPAHDEAAS